tara:strand:+ start:6695 stop:7399 length:705 start_codon:yes stop_codon:yes gene_type:complete
MIFVHIGAGAGDLDPSTNFRDGFSEYVKKIKSEEKNIFVVEANPNNIEKLKECWKDYKYVEIFNFAVTPNDHSKENITLYYSQDDKPHYQLLSHDKNFVKHYFPNSAIKEIEIKTIKIKTFLEKNFSNLIIDSFSIDVEGLDYKIFMDIDLKKFNIYQFSIEYFHLNKNQKKDIIKKFIKNGYSYNGFGLDHNNLDWLFIKKRSFWNNFIVKIFPYIHRIHYKRLNTLIEKLQK